VSGTARDGSPVDLYVLLPERGEGELIALAVPAAGTILELGCGTGRITRQLLARGYGVVAVDESAEMLAHVFGAETICADIEGLALDRRFDASLLASNLVNTESPARRRDFLETCVRHAPLVVIERLPPDWEPSVAPGRLGELDTWLEDVDRDGDLVRGAVIYESGSEHWRHEFTMRVLDDAALSAALAEAGLHVERYLDDRRCWLVASR
jgi:SAM-dependent methyltransferase